MLRHTCSLRHVAVIRSAHGAERFPLHSAEGQEESLVPKPTWMQAARYLLHEGIGVGEEALSWLNSHGALGLTGAFYVNSSLDTYKWLEMPK